MNAMSKFRRAFMAVAAPLKEPLSTVRAAFKTAAAYAVKPIVQSSFGRAFRIAAASFAMVIGMGAINQLRAQDIGPPGDPVPTVPASKADTLPWQTQDYFNESNLWKAERDAAVRVAQANMKIKKDRIDERRRNENNRDGAVRKRGGNITIDILGIPEQRRNNREAENEKARVDAELIQIVVAIDARHQEKQRRTDLKFQAFYKIAHPTARVTAPVKSAPLSDEAQADANRMACQKLETNLMARNQELPPNSACGKVLHPPKPPGG